MMKRITVYRNGVSYGPYTDAQLKLYLENNKLLLNDLAQVEGTSEIVALSRAMKQCGWKMPQAKNPIEGLKRIGFDFVFPWKSICSLSWAKDLKFLYLSIIGLIPLLIVMLSKGHFAYVALAAYFSVLWGFFFYSLMKTDESSVRMCAGCSVFTMFTSMPLLMLANGLGVFSFFDSLNGSTFYPLQFLGMFVKTAMPEEICKALAIFITVRRPGAIYKPQTIVLMGMFSGLAFGIHEGVEYQLAINRKMGVDEAYFLNILRLTSLPFLHAVYCGISSYFISFATLYPIYRWGLWILGILIPAIFHTLHNTLGAFDIIPAFLVVLLFSLYLANAKDMQKKLK